MMTRNLPWMTLAAVAAFDVLAGTVAHDLGLLAAAAAVAFVLMAVAGRLAKRDPHDALVRRIEQQMKAHRRVARAQRAGAHQGKSGCA